MCDRCDGELAKKIEKAQKEIRNNKKEIERMAAVLENLSEELRPAIDLLHGSIVMRRVILWFTSVLLALASTWYALKNIIR